MRIILFVTFLALSIPHSLAGFVEKAEIADLDTELQRAGVSNDSIKAIQAVANGTVINNFCGEEYFSSSSIDGLSDYVVNYVSVPKQMAEKYTLLYVRLKKKDIGTDPASVLKYCKLIGSFLQK